MKSLARHPGLFMLTAILMPLGVTLSTMRTSLPVLAQLLVAGAVSLASGLAGSALADWSDAKSDQ